MITEDRIKELLDANSANMVQHPRQNEVRDLCELALLALRLPVTADGVRVVPDMKLYRRGGVCVGIVRSVGNGVADTATGSVYVTELMYADPEAAKEAAMSDKRELVQRGYAEYVAPEPGLPATEFRLIEPGDPQQKGD